MAAGGCGGSHADNPNSSGCPHQRANQQAVIDWVDFVRLGGTEYLATQTGEPNLQATDLGRVVARVQCRIDGNVSDPGYHGKDGDAAFLDPGTALYAVKGYKPSFRLAARQEGRIVLFEADTVADARVGADLLDIAEKVRYIGINSPTDGVTELGAVRNAAQVKALTDLVLRAPVNQQRMPDDSTRYVIVFHMDDGTTVARTYWPTTGELQRGIMVSDEFRRAIEQALTN